MRKFFLAFLRLLNYILCMAQKIRKKMGAYEVRFDLTKILRTEELMEFERAAREAGRTITEHAEILMFGPPVLPTHRRASRPVASPHPTSASRRAGRKTKA